MLDYDAQKSLLHGPKGALPISPDDQVSLKLAMLFQGECTKTGPAQAAENFNYCRSRYYQLLKAFTQHGSKALINQKTGPKGNYRRTSEVTKLVIRARFLDPKASPEVIASKLQQDGHCISTRSVERIIHDFGLQKKTPSPLPPSPTQTD